MSTSTTSPSLPSPETSHSPETTRQIAEARAALEASILNIGSSLDSSLKSRASNLHSNSTALEKQQKDLVKQTDGLRKETDKLKKLADEGGKKVKELGNVQNWAEMLERDFLLLEETIRLANEGDSESEWDTESSVSLSDREEEGRLRAHPESEVKSQESKERKDHEGDTEMDGTEVVDKGKGKEIVVDQIEAPGGSSTATGSGTDQGSGSASASIAS